MASSSRKRGGIRHVKKAPKIDTVRNEINVTPLVDVCLVLLIIFMVVLPLMERGYQIDLPTTRHHEDGKDTQQPIVVLTREGDLYVDKEKMDSTSKMTARVQEQWEELAANNSRLKKTDRTGEGRVLLKAHPQALYKKVYPVIMAIHEAGATGIDLGTEEVADE